MSTLVGYRIKHPTQDLWTDGWFNYVVFEKSCKYKLTTGPEHYEDVARSYDPPGILCEVHGLEDGTEHIVVPDACPPTTRSPEAQRLPEPVEPSVTDAPHGIRRGYSWDVGEYMINVDERSTKMSLFMPDSIEVKDLTKAEAQALHQALGEAIARMP